MDLPEINRVLKLVEHNIEYDCYPDGNNFVDIRVTEEQWEEIHGVIKMLNVAEMTNYKTAQAAFPKLVGAVKLVLGLNTRITVHGEENPRPPELEGASDVVSLSSKTKAQLRRALKVAGEQDH